MATKKITTSAAPRVIYRSDCGRVTVEQHGRRDYLALFDDQPCGFFQFAFQAEAAGHEALGAAIERERIEALDDEVAPAEARVVRVETCICEDEIDVERLGQPIGVEFVAGEERHGVRIYIANDLRQRDQMDVLIFDNIAIPIADMEKALPLLQAILADPRFQAARAAV